jgi:hypothetical protein
MFVWNGELEVRVLKRLAYSNSLRRIKRKQSSHKVEELPVDRVCRRNDVLQRAVVSKTKITRQAKMINL